jgi:hypothetical protein
VAQELKGARFALWKHPEDLTRRQRGKLAEVNQRLYRAYLLKQELRLVFKVKGQRAVALLDAWLSWARRCRIPAFIALAGSVTVYRDTIVASLLHGASNARVESVNTKLRLLTRIAFGFTSPEALIGLAMLALGGLCPALPGRAYSNPQMQHKSPFSAAARRISFSMVSCPTLRSACRNARSSADRSGRCPFRASLPPSRKSSRQAARRCASTPSSRDSLSSGSPPSSRNTASIFLPADHLGRDR